MPVVGPGAGASLWTPLRIPTLLAWYDAADTSTLVVSGSSVSQWCDKSRNAFAATQATGANQPTLGVTRAGLNTLTFDPAAPSSLFSRTLTSPQPLTIFAVAASNVVDGENRQLLGNQSSTPIIFKRSDWRLFAGSELASGVTADTNWHVFAADFNGASSTLRLDGRQIAAGDPSTAGYATKSIVVGYGGNPNNWSGQIAEIIILSRLATTEERNAVERYLGTKWQIPLSAGGASSPPLEFR